VWLDDSQVVDLRIRKAPTIGGMVKVWVQEVHHA
jgi:Holliday junction resolvase RusA-like endonuclease